RAGVLVTRLHRAALVRQQRDERGGTRTRRDDADEPVARDDRRLLVDAGVAARRDHDTLVELVAPPDDPRVHRRVVTGEGRAVAEVELPAQLGVLRARRLAEQRLLAQLVHLGLELLVLTLDVDEAGEVAVDVAERPGDALSGDLERPQDGRAGGLHPM